MSETILVFGSNSFTASHFIDYLLKHTNWNILAVSRSSEYDALFLPYKYKADSKIERIEFHRLDLNRELAKILDLIDSHKPSYIANFAAQGEVRNSWRWPQQWYQTNTLGIVCLADELRKRDFLKRYLNCSTPEVYGSTGENIVENQCYAPSTPYAASKLGGDLFLQVLCKRYGFPVVSTRSANLYGIHQQLYRIIPRTILYARLGRKLQLHGGGRARRAFIHARDVAFGTYLVLTKGRVGDVYHLSPSDSLLSIAALVRLICERLGADFSSLVEMVDENFGQDDVFSISSGKIRQELGWKAEVLLEDGIDETIAWIDANLDKISRYPLDYIHKP